MSSINPTPRDYNKASVLDVVLSHAPLTRNKLIELTGLSKATVSRAVEELRSDGFVVDGGVDAVAGRGRPSTYLDVPETAGHVVGVGFGVVTTGVLVTDLRGREIGHVIVPTVEHHDVPAAGRWLVDLIAQTSASARGPLRQVVVALPAHVRDGAEVFRPADPMRIFSGRDLHRTVEELVDAPVTFDSDANASLLQVLTDDASIHNAALFSVSSTLNFATCRDRELARGRTPAFGDIGSLPSGIDDRTLNGLLSTAGLVELAREQGLDVERVEDLWLAPQDHRARAEMLKAFTTAVTTAVSIVAVTLDPESVYFVGRLRPLVDEVLPEVRKRLEQTLPVIPRITTVSQVLGLSVARGAVHACLAMTHNRLRDALLKARGQGPRQEQAAPAF
ncbi:ROK family transcriptional regulator [Streptomyces cynarae]|uniref:ROK family transcriptional regulator n=1 Tax=Streptomyces cynarae TaxID=2981134 RepID=A0ABY6E4U5_9ACTN|nr:ROK family transcriptional regulator [Streptomyces cynarae]UXY21700.1 ROK family transcriptional regulator [Streptomyces cynarae]